MWCTRFRPTDLDELDLHPASQNILQSLSTSKNLPHLLFVGSSGSGRHTRALCLLKRIFNLTSINPISSTVTYTHNTQQNELTVVSSPVHLEINPSMVGTQDASVISSVIKEAATTKSVNSAFKVIFIQQADRLSQLAQQALRRLMEEHARTCKIFMFCEDASGLLAPIRSRCFILRFPHIKQNEMLSTIKPILSRVRASISQQELVELSDCAQGNLRRFLLLSQAYYVSKEASNQVQEVLPKWEVRSKQLFDKFFIKKEQLSADFRAGLVEVLKLGVPPEVVLEWFYTQIVKQEPVNMKFLNYVAGQACEFDCRLKGASIGLVHLEAFLCSVLHAQSLRKE
ncbi:Replication_factor C [Hexamita inflata]|uniref:Subunit 5 n=1 Tax=Hexamita inflata TaxID=28002 RepID=A0AA86RCM6_9EUKA|nr:Replication factor C [Hexamita inflata]CAI9975105.1 Replication factor C [Hexamita inflata]